jgi:hypothetical protein
MDAQRQIDSRPKRRARAIHAKESSGLLLIAFVLLVLTVIRYWPALHAGLRWR